MSLIADLYIQELGRAPDASGLQNWQNQLDAGVMTIEEIQQGINDSIEGQIYDANQQLQKKETVPDDTSKLLDQMRIDYQQQMDTLQASQAKQMSSLTSAMEQLRIDSQPKQVSSKTYRSGIVGTTKTGNTLADAEIDKRREAVNKSFLGAKQMRIKLANDGVATKGTSGTNTGNNTGLAI